MADIFSHFLTQALGTVGVIVGCGFIVWCLEHAFFKTTGRGGAFCWKIVGAVGTPVHELGHAMFCVIFGHKIVEMRLYTPNDKEGVMGYVNHSYNRKNIYHQIGNFFIGVGPILLGTAVIIGFMLCFVRSILFDTFDIVFSHDLAAYETSGQFCVAVLDMVWSSMVVLFDPWYFTYPLWWLFMALSLSVALHMSLSPPDIRGSILGLCVLLSLLFAVNVIFHFIAEAWVYEMSYYAIAIGGIMLNFLVIAIVFSLVALILAFLIRPIPLIGGKRRFR
jgi:hypothetical protein